jgi:hypothetical protein
MKPSVRTEITEKRVKHFWSRVNKTDGCWEWTLRPSTPFGYCRYNKELIHRFAWRVTYGEMPDGIQVLHKCDNPRCCRPDHLFLGTQLDNVRDMFKKGRAAKRVARRGDDNHWTTIKDAQVKEIIALYESGMVQRHIAFKFGCSPAQVCRIVNRKSRAYDVPEQTAT